LLLEKVRSDRPQERYSSKCLFNKDITNDPYDFTGFICCSIYFTKEQKEKMKDFPPLPEKETIGDDIVEKMVYTVRDKYKYYISSEALKQLLESDWATLDCIWGAVQYSIGPVMEDFVDKITQKRQNARKSDIQVQTRFR
jgi:hypothetical protein